MFLLVAAVALPLLLLASGSIYDGYRRDRLRAEERLTEQARALALVVDRELARVQAVLQTLATSTSVASGDMAGFEAELRDAAQFLRGGNIGLIGEDNGMKLSTLWPPGVIRPGVPGPEQFRSIFQSGQPMIGNMFVGGNTHRLTLAVAVPVRTRGGGDPISGKYYLSAGVPLASLNALLAEQHLQPGWVAGLLDRNNKLAARSAEADRFVGSDAIPEMAAALRTADSGVIRVHRVDGVLASVAFAHAPASGFTLALAAPDEVFAGPLHEALTRALLTGAILCGGALGLALVLARRIAGSIQGLAEGDSAPPRPAVRLREVEMVADRLAATAAQRDRAEAALRALATHLEEQVAERTEELAESEARLRGIFDAQFQAITLMTPDGRRLDQNQATRDFRGANADQMIGKPVWEADWWKHDPANATLLREMVQRASAGESVRFELTSRNSNGEPHTHDLSIRPIRHAVTGAVRLLVGEAHDITALRALEARVAQTSRLEALGQLAGGVAHDFNNVLQSLSGGVSLIARRADDPAVVRRLAELAMEAIGRGASVTRRLLSFARRDALRAAPLDAAELLHDLREVLTHTLGASIVVKVEAAPDLPHLLADRSQLETVLVNLATNARDAMPNGGTLRLTAQAETIATPPDGTALAPGCYIRLSASDTGTGMDAATQARALEPFFTTKPVGSGNGLGLPMARGFAEQSGGALALASTPGAGTTVTLWLPQQTDVASPPPPAPPERPPAAADASGPALLLVDDDDLVRETLTEALKFFGYRVAAKADAAAALAHLDRGERVALLISDLSMPGMSGIELIREAQRRRPGLPGILLTGHASEAAVLAAGGTLNGQINLLRKPLSAAHLADQVAAMLEAAALA